MRQAPAPVGDLEPPVAAAQRLGTGLLASRRRQLRIVLALLALLVVAGTAWSVAAARRGIEQEALTQAALYARVLEDQVARVVDASAGTLRSLADAPVAALARSNPAAVTQLMAPRLAAQPYLRSLSVLDADGRVLASTTSTNVGLRVPLERLARRAGSPQPDALGGVVVARDLSDLETAGTTASRATALPLARRLDDQGKPLWLVALLNVDHITNQHGLITSGQPVTAVLLDIDGQVISDSREGGLEPGTKRASLPPFNGFLPQRDSGTYVGEGSDGGRSAAAFRALRQWPLVVLAEYPYTEVQSEWTRRAAGTAVVASFLLLLLATLGLVAHRGLRTEQAAMEQTEQLHAELVRAEERWKLALDGAGHGVWDIDLATGTASISAQHMALLGFDERAVTWTMSDWRQHVHPDDVAEVLQAADRHLRGEVPALEAEMRMRTRSGDWKWVLSRGTSPPGAEPGVRGRRLIGTITDISQRKAAEAALRESEARQQAILRSALDGIVTIDLNGRVVDFNPAAEAIFGFAQGAVLGRPMHELMVPEKHRAAHTAGMRHYAETGIGPVLNQRIETEGLRASGEVFPIELAVVPVSTDSGQVFTATVRDISEQQRIQRALRDSEEQLRATFEQAAVGMVHQTRDRRILRVNQTVCEMLGYSREELVAMGVEDLIHPDERSHGLPQMEQLFAGTIGSYSQEKRYRHKAGHYLWSRLTASLARDSTGQPLHMICVIENIEDRRRAELDRDALFGRYRDTALELEQQRLALDQHAIFAITDAKGTITYVNSRMAAVSGFEASELLGLRHSALVPSEDAITPRALKWTTEGERPLGTEVLDCVRRSAIWTGELVHRRKDGATFWAATTIVPMRDEGGRLRQIFIVQTDITPRVRAEIELDAARRREMFIGARIQRSLLVEPPDQRLPGLWLSTLSQASQGIDGDFIELIPLGDRGIDVIVGDVMGKGIAAALMGAATKSQFSRCIAELMARPDREGELPSPAEVVAAVHRAMTPNLQALEAFVTLCYVRLDVAAGTLTWIGCGHEEPVLVRPDGRTVALANQHPPMGVLEGAHFTQDTMPLQLDDKLLLSSDGAADAVMPDGTRLGRERLLDLLARLLSRLRTPAAILHALRRDLATIGASITDDLTLALAISSGDREQNSRRELSDGLADVLHVRKLIGHRLDAAGFPETEAGLFTVACVEAFTNIVRHTRHRPADAPIELVVHTTPQACVVELIALGEPFQAQATQRESRFEEYPEGGFGLTIMHGATDRVEHEHALGVNTTRLTLLRRAG